MQSNDDNNNNRRGKERKHNLKTIANTTIKRQKILKDKNADADLRTDHICIYPSLEVHKTTDSWMHGGPTTRWWTISTK